MHDPTHAIVYQPLEVEADGLTFEEQLVKIVDQMVKQLRNKAIPLVKVIWTHHGASEATWETQDEIKQHYPYLFGGTFSISFENETFFKGGRM